ncbi:unnamed protein product [Urochloa decumbens]|uniref:Uncharacterized protein n=1 Tax=Urochloa decumbens TaxID=240449 RepID=A0ABC9BYJ5_9POAL
MDAAGGNADTRTVIPIHGGPTQEIVLDMDEWAARAAASLEADFSMAEAKIHRFPRGLRGIGGGDDRYIAPSVVAIGPYHHGLPHLQKMEAVKLAAAHYLCRDTAAGRSTVDQAYSRVRLVAGAARACYDADDPSVAGVGEAEFAAMMFLDGCFLLQYMAVADDENAAPVLRNRMTLSTGPSIQKDIFLLENQIPELVLDALMEFVSVDVHVHGFVKGMGDKFLPGRAKKARRTQCWRGGGVEMDGHSSRPPPHLLGHLRFTQVGSMPASETNYRSLPVDSSLSISAVELEEMGVRLAASTAPWFGDMSVRRRPLFGELSLSPLFLNDVTACWLVNVAALEASTYGVSRESDDFVVGSYLSVLAMLMDSEADVQQMRAKHLLYSTFSNAQALEFFKGLARHLHFGQRYLAVLEMIQAYKRRRAVRICAHKFVYTYYKAIVAVLSIAGVLVSILKALYSLKKP